MHPPPFHGRLLCRFHKSSKCHQLQFIVLTENREVQCIARQIQLNVIVYKETHFDEKLVHGVLPKQARSTEAHSRQSIVKECLP